MCIHCDGEHKLGSSCGINVAYLKGQRKGHQRENTKRKENSIRLHVAADSVIYSRILPFPFHNYANQITVHPHPQTRMLNAICTVNFTLFGSFLSAQL